MTRSAVSLLVLSTLVLWGCGQGQSIAPQVTPSYFGKNTKEAEFSFEAYYVKPKSAGVPTEASVYEDVKKTVKYTLGRMHEDGSFRTTFKTQLKKVEETQESYKIKYKFEAQGIFKASLDEYEFIVPINHETLASEANGKCYGNPAGDDTSFWYYWSPFVINCPLVENQHYLKVKAKLKEIKSTKESFPEYEKLVINNKLTMTIFFGAADYNNKNWNPLSENGDYGASDYIQTRDYLISLGLTARQFEEQELREVYNPQDTQRLPFAEEFTKVGDNGRTLRVRMVFLQTGYNYDSEAFHHFYRKSLAEDSVVMYQGHAGLGKNVNIDYIERKLGSKIKLSDSYQILYFGSCVPYAYYADMYLSRKMNKDDKNGTKKLDLFVYGKESHFGNTENQNFLLALSKYVFTNERTSYQKIITETPVDFFGVLGDEDNN